jgi:exopolysaccharide biosynthesis WecB/TagA/CpsF family protein
MISPPYRALTDDEQAEYIKQINDAKADIVWIGLGAPKQELWMQKYAPQIHGVLAGVGAGFDFHAGTIKRAPKWVQRMSLEWLYRLFQDPARLFKRYFVTNTKYLWYSLRDK